MSMFQSESTLTCQFTRAKFQAGYVSCHEMQLQWQVANKSRLSSLKYVIRMPSYTASGINIYFFRYPK